jgi:hypothetical protein
MEEPSSEVQNIPALLEHSTSIDWSIPARFQIDLNILARFQNPRVPGVIQTAQKPPGFQAFALSGTTPALVGELSSCKFLEFCTAVSKQASKQASNQGSK